MSHPEFEDVGNSDPRIRATEEAAELITAIAKANRFGWFNVHNSKSNLQAVLDEIEDCKIQFKRLEELLSQLKEHQNIIEKPLGA